jgi:hypothetical protein
MHKRTTIRSNSFGHSTLRGYNEKSIKGQDPEVYRVNEDDGKFRIICQEGWTEHYTGDDIKNNYCVKCTESCKVCKYESSNCTECYDGDWLKSTENLANLWGADRSQCLACDSRFCKTCEGSPTHC